MRRLLLAVIAVLCLAPICDAQGYSVCSAPAAGWWGLSALIDGELQTTVGGAAMTIEHPKLGAKAVEIGAVLWIKAHAPVLTR